MTEQGKREKVIDGLKCCAAMSGDECKKCPYSKECLDKDLPYGMPHLAADALALLKEQKPRVMTSEEVVGNIVLKHDVILWFEFHDIIKELNVKDIEYNDYLCDDDMPTLYEPNLKWWDNGYLDGVIIFEYNDVFRCWTSRPDQATREATPWN